jgi:ubiquinol-cytochrome c reductase cytochrome b subunit
MMPRRTWKLLTTIQSLLKQTAKAGILFVVAPKVANAAQTGGDVGTQTEPEPGIDIGPPTASPPRRGVLARIEDRTGLLAKLGPVARHPVPPNTGWMYVFGSATLIAFLIQVATGIALALSYVPSAAHAYDTLQFITHKAPLGHLLRGMHYFGASAMVLFIGVHLLRVYLTGAYKFPREASWLTGVALLICTMLMGFTGQLLRWDQNAIWSAVVAADQAARMPYIGGWLAHFTIGGDTVSGVTLSRFFAAHVFFIPAILFAIVGLHLFLVLRNGISEPPGAGLIVDPRTYRRNYNQLLKEHGVPFWPDAAWRDAVFGLALVAGVIALAHWVGPPELTKPPDPALIDAMPRPDWYLLWYFAVLALLPHGGEAYVIVLGPLTFFTVLILLPFFFNKGERSPRRRPWAVAFSVLAVLIIAVFWIQARQAPWSPRFNAQPVPLAMAGSSSPQASEGLHLFNVKGCLYCHRISGYGGIRGPDLTYVGDRLTSQQLIIRMMNGGYNMPSYSNILKPDQIDALMAFLQSRTTVPQSASAPAF